MNEQAADIVVVSRGEPEGRLRRLFQSCATQSYACDLYIAAPESDRDTITRAAMGIGLSVHYVANPEGGRSVGLNKALAAATQTFVCRLDARTLPPPDYVQRCLKVLVSNEDVGIVGGVQRPVALGRGVVERGVARSLANPYAVGAPAYRRGSHSGAVDTVYLGAFRRDELIMLGGYNESLEANEDYELAARYRAAGKTVWLDSELVHSYEVRRSLKGVALQYRAFGKSKVQYWRLTHARPNPRQSGALVIVPTALMVVAASQRRAAWIVRGFVGVALIDHFVAPEERSLLVRGVATGVSCMLPLCWVAGIVEEASRRPKLGLT